MNYAASLVDDDDKSEKPRMTCGLSMFGCAVGCMCDCRNKLIKIEIIVNTEASDSFHTNREDFFDYEAIDVPVEGFTGSSRIKDNGIV